MYYLKICNQQNSIQMIIILKYSFVKVSSMMFNTYRNRLKCTMCQIQYYHKSMKNISFKLQVAGSDIPVNILYLPPSVAKYVQCNVF